MEYEIRSKKHPTYNMYGEIERTYIEAPMAKVQEKPFGEHLQAVCINGRWFVLADEQLQREWESKWADAAS